MAVLSMVYNLDFCMYISWWCFLSDFCYVGLRVLQGADWFLW